MSKFHRNRIKDGWEKLCTNKQTNQQTLRKYWSLGRAPKITSDVSSRNCVVHWNGNDRKKLH